jgi:Kef-type K+ transport system membrane component KefB
VVAGPALLGFAGDDEFVGGLGQLGVILLMFLAGLETDPSGLRSVGRTAAAVAVGGVVLPFGAATESGCLPVWIPCTHSSWGNLDGDVGEHHG